MNATRFIDSNNRLRQQSKKKQLRKIKKKKLLKLYKPNPFLRKFSVWPNAGHLLFACDGPHLPQETRDDYCMLFASRNGIDDRLLF